MNHEIAVFYLLKAFQNDGYSQTELLGINNGFVNALNMFTHNEMININLKYEYNFSENIEYFTGYAIGFRTAMDYISKNMFEILLEKYTNVSY